MVDLGLPTTLEGILACDTDIVALRLGAVSNMQLLDEFKLAFSIMHDYAPKDEAERWQILDYSRAFIDQFKIRIRTGGDAGIKEFTTRIQIMMRQDKTEAETYYTRNLVRLYSFCLMAMKNKGMDIKKDFL